MPSATFDVSAATSTTVVTVPTGQRVKMQGYVLGAAAAQTIVWKTGSTAKTGVIPLVANGNLAVVAPKVAEDDSEGWFIGADGEDLVLTTTTTAQTGGHVAYELILA